jgi:protocatechuate 3,4-dioxygenase beta subunit
MKRQRPTRLICVLLGIFPFLVAPGLAADTKPSTEPDPIATTIWRLERGITHWIQRIHLSSATSSSAQVTATIEELEVDAERFRRQLRSLEAALGATQGTRERLLQRKLAHLERLLEPRSVSQRATRREGRPDPRPAPYPPPGPPTIVQVTTQCESAVTIEEGTIAWQFPAEPGQSLQDPTTGEAWFRFVASRDALLVAHTGGSRADTEIELYRSCSGIETPIAANDDSIGLVSAVSFPVTTGSTWWIRVLQRTGLPAEPVMLTLESAGVIEGTITEAGTGRALADIQVAIREYDTGHYVGWGYTNENGTYQVTGLGTGSYVARTEHSEEHLDELWDDHPCYNDCDVTTGDRIQVIDGWTTRGIDFDLQRAGAISGRVRDAVTQEALEDVWVEVTDAEGSWSESGHTDASGRFSIGGLAPGTYFASTDANDYRDEVFDNYPCLPDCQPIDGTPIPVMAEETVTGIDFDLEQLGSIEGTLVDAATERPIAFASLEFYDATGERAGSAETDSSGRYIGGGLEAGTYFVVTDFWGGYRNEVYDDLPCPGRYSWDCDVLAGQPVQVALHSTTQGIDFALDRLGGFAGLILEEDTMLPIDSLDITVWTASGDQQDRVRTNILGTYVVEDLYPSEYFATTDSDTGHLDELYDDLPCPGGDTNGCDPTTGDPIAVTLASFTTGIDFELTLGGVATGVLMDALTGAPLDNATVELWAATGALVDREWTGDAGRYWFSALPEGTYFVTTDTWGSYLDELYDDFPCPGGAPPGCDPTTGSPVNVIHGDTTTGLDFDLLLRGGLAGTIEALGTGEPLAGVAVDVWDAQGQHVAASASDTYGVYQVDLSSGTYYVATDNSLGYIDEVYDGLRCPEGPAILGLCDPLSGEPVVVLGAEQVVIGIDFALVERVVFSDGFESGDTSAWTSSTGRVDQAQEAIN